VNTCATTEFVHWNANGFRPGLQRCDDSLLIHNANGISINARWQQQSCKSAQVSIPATSRHVTGLESDTAFVRDLCRWAKLAPSRLAANAGIAATTMLRPFNGTATTRIGQTTIDKLKAVFPDYPGWRRETSDHIGQMGERMPPDEPVDELAYVRSVDISLAMGTGLVVDDYPQAELVPFNLGFLRAITKATSEKLVIMTGQGESMEPTLLRSDLLMVDTSHRHPAISDQIWAFHYAGGGMIKRLRRVREGGLDRFLILSDNPSVPDQMADIEDIHIIGKLIWVGRRM
jgi:phage repressor protein C with HTH and peptisase S24 domain